MNLFRACKVVTLVLGLVMSFPGNVWSVDLFIEASLHNGGASVPTREMLGRQPNNQINAGGGLGAALGMVIPVADKIELIGTFGTHVFASGDLIFDIFNGKDRVSWAMQTATVVGAYRDDEWRFGAGLVFHFNPTLHNSDGLDSTLWKYDNALGYHLTIERDYDEEITICGYANIIDYEIPGEASVSGNSLGIGVRFSIGD